MLSVGGLCTLHRGFPRVSVIGQTSHMVQVIGVNTRGIILAYICLSQVVHGLLLSFSEELQKHNRLIMHGLFAPSAIVCIFLDV